MRRRLKPHLRKGPASAFEEPNEIIREFSGGLVSIRNTEDGLIVVEVYQTDANVRVRGPDLREEIARRLDDEAEDAQ